jgi:N-acetylmuramoyl-L-alanine amidase
MIGRGPELRASLFILTLITILFLGEWVVFGQDVVIVLDAGHGGQDPGVVGVGGLTEKEVSLDLAGRVKERIDRHLGYRTFLTRSRDETLSLKERASLANNYRGTVYVSIHLAGFPDPSLQGFGVFYYDPFPKSLILREEPEKSAAMWNAQQLPHTDSSRRLAELLHHQFLQFFPSQIDLGVRPLPIYPFGALDMPAVLIEPVAITHPVQEDLLQEEEFRENIAEAIFQGVQLFVKQRPLRGNNE